MNRKSYRRGILTLYFAVAPVIFPGNSHSENLCREADGYFSQERIFSGQLKMDSVLFYKLGDVSVFDSYRYQYDQDKLVALDLNGTRYTITHPSADVVEWHIPDPSQTMRYHLAPSREVDSIVILRSSSVFARQRYSYTDSTFVFRFFLANGELLETDSVLYGASTRYFRQWGSSPFRPERIGYCRVQGNHCLCYADSAYTVKAELEHDFELQNGRLRRIVNGDGAKNRELFWPGVQISVFSNKVPGRSLSINPNRRLDGRQVLPAIPPAHQILFPAYPFHSRP